ncbi:unnamed protein product [Arctogadus glacialis]
MGVDEQPLCKTDRCGVETLLIGTGQLWRGLQCLILHSGDTLPLSSPPEHPPPGANESVRSALLEDGRRPSHCLQHS